MCQGIHAAYESGLHLTSPTDEIHYTVVCQVPDEMSLLKAQYDIEHMGFRTVLFKEPDLGNQATALATEPIPECVKKKFSKYQLWK